MFKKPVQLLAATALVTSALADSAITGSDLDGSTLATVDSSASVNLRSNYSYTFESDFDDESMGALSVNRFNATARVPIPLSDNLRLQTGVTYRRLDFSSSSSLVPDQMQGIAALIGLEYLINGQPVAGLQSAPGFYFIDDIESDAFNAPTLLYAGWRFSEKFIAIAGASYSGLREDNKVIPIAGFLWTITDDIKFNAILPVASLDFNVNDDVKFSVIGEFVGFRAHTGDDLANEDYQDSTLNYTELRAGAQLSYDLSDSASIRVSGGWAFRQELEFEEQDEDYKTGGAPFVGISFRKSF